MFRDKLISLKISNFSGIISSTTVKIHFFTKSPSLKGFVSLAIKLVQHFFLSNSVV